MGNRQEEGSGFPYVDMQTFYAEIYVILACAYEIQSQNRTDKYVSFCCDSLAALKALKAVRTTSRLVQQCQKTFNDISVRHAVSLVWFLEHAGIRVMK